MLVADVDDCQHLAYVDNRQLRRVARHRGTASSRKRSRRTPQHLLRAPGTGKQERENRMATYLYRLGRFVTRRRRLVVSVWVVLLVGMIALAIGSGGKTVDNFTVPGTQSQQATDLLAKRIPAFAGAETQVVFATSEPAKVTESVYRTSIEAALANLRKVPQVAVVSDPFQTGSIAADGRAALARVQYSASSANVKTSTLDALNAAVTPSRDAGVQTEFSGSVYPGSAPKISELPEVIGIAIGFLILLFPFGTLAAAGLPILTAHIGQVIAFIAYT